MSLIHNGNEQDENNTNNINIHSELKPLLPTHHHIHDHDDENCNQTIPTKKNKKKKRGTSTFLTTGSLAFAMLVQSYLLVGVFPYSGFLAMHLIPNVTEETAGKYAGWIASSFMIGRTFSSFEWGKAADRYGRTVVIQWSLILSAIFSILFGLAPTFPLALISRFVLGLCNGLIGPIKTLISELSHGDTSKETKMMAIVGGMWGYGFLLNPAISGYLSDPVKQYPNSKWVRAWTISGNDINDIGDGDGTTPLLSIFPFLLPNVCGCLFCLVGFALVYFFVEETLPLEQRQVLNVPRLFPRCSKSSLTSTMAISTTTTTTTTALESRRGLVRRVSSWGLFKHMHFATAEIQSDKDGQDGNGIIASDSPRRRSDQDPTLQQTPTDIQTYDATSIPHWIRPSPSTTALVMLSPRTTAAMAKEKDLIFDEKDVNMRTKEDMEHNQRDVHQQPHSAQIPIPPATISSLWHQQSTRQHLLVYWVYSFLVISVDEAFPLFCISKDSGLAIEERMIGNLLSGTGVVYIAMQYFLLTNLVDRFGFYKSLRIGALCSIPLVSLIPISLITNLGAPSGSLTWSTLIFLSIIYAISRAFASVTFSTLTMTTNRTVIPTHRATMNGFSMLGGSLAKAAGPAFTGILFSTSVDYITPPFGSVVVYSIISLLGIGLFVQSLFLPEHSNDYDSKNEKKTTSSEFQDTVIGKDAMKE